MNILTFPELFCLISINLNDKEKIFLISCSKIIYNFKSLLILDSEYIFEEINDKWRVKNIIIKEFSLENKIKELIKDLIPESIATNSKYVKFTSNNMNIKLFYDGKIIEKLISYDCSYLAMKIMLNNDESIDNINKQFISASHYGYLDIIKLLVNLGADVNVDDGEAIIWASSVGDLDMVKLLIELEANIHSQSNQALILASGIVYILLVKLLIESGADIHAQNNRAIISSSRHGHLSIVKLLIESGADIHARNNEAIIDASYLGNLSMVKLLIESGADIHARNNRALKYAKMMKHPDIIELLTKN